MNIFKKAFESIGNFLTSVFAKSAQLSQAAVEAVNIIKRGVDSGLLDIATLIIPGEVDDKILKALREYLPKVALALSYVNQKSKNSTAESVLAELIQWLQTLPVSERNEKYKTLSAMVFREMKNKEITLDRAVEITQEVYHILKAKDSTPE